MYASVLHFVAIFGQMKLLI